jgi:putative transposase
MAKKRFTAEQIVAILREAEKLPTNEEVLRKHGISEQTFYRWKKMYANLEIVEVQRIEQLEKENRQLKQLAGDQALAIQILQERSKKNGYGSRSSGKWLVSFGRRSLLKDELTWHFRRTVPVFGTVTKRRIQPMYWFERRSCNWPGGNGNTGRRG